MLFLLSIGWLDHSRLLTLNNIFYLSSTATLVFLYVRGNILTKRIMPMMRLTYLIGYWLFIRGMIPVSFPLLHFLIFVYYTLFILPIEDNRAEKFWNMNRIYEFSTYIYWGDMDFLWIKYINLIDRQEPTLRVKSLIFVLRGGGEGGIINCTWKEKDGPIICDGKMRWNIGYKGIWCRNSTLTWIRWRER